jgi:hypothetical protein
MNLTEVVVAGTEFDAMWAIALGLQSASDKVRINDTAGCEDLPGELVPLEHFEYVNDKMGCVLRKSFQQVSFSGITVSCRYHIHLATLYLIFRGQLCLIVMEAGMPESFVFNDILLQVVNSKCCTLQIYAPSVGNDVSIITAAEIVIKPNSSQLIPREDVGLWTGVYCRTLWKRVPCLNWQVI